MRRITYIILCCTMIINFISVGVYAHPGRLDSNGGHYNRQTGEYLYHDGNSGHSDIKQNDNSVIKKNETSFLKNIGQTILLIVEFVLVIVLSYAIFMVVVYYIFLGAYKFTIWLHKKFFRE